MDFFIARAININIALVATMESEEVWENGFDRIREFIRSLVLAGADDFEGALVKIKTMSQTVRVSVGVSA